MMMMIIIMIMIMMGYDLQQERNMSITSRDHSEEQIRKTTQKMATKTEDSSGFMGTLGEIET